MQKTHIFDFKKFVYFLRLSKFTLQLDKLIHKHVITFQIVDKNNLQETK